MEDPEHRLSRPNSACQLSRSIEVPTSASSSKMGHKAWDLGHPPCIFCFGGRVEGVTEGRVVQKGPICPKIRQNGALVNSPRPSVVTNIDRKCTLRVLHLGRQRIGRQIVILRVSSLTQTPPSPSSSRAAEGCTKLLRSFSAQTTPVSRLALRERS